ncbi:MAG: HAD-IIB family hydrolase [Clostridia bacterium]|nr:HAD-IIB family hydrolase [Clostridia bacterium]
MIFFTDIDNTLIFSKKRSPENSICVEYKDGQPLSFMTEKSIELYNELCEKITVIPVTTRSTEQFMRIEYIKNSHYAIVSNGAKLFVNGVEDKEWTNYYNSCVENCIPVFEKCRNTLKKTFPLCNVRMADNIFLYSRFDDNSHTAFEILSDLCKNDNVNISESHGKIYVIPSEIGKGNAIKRFIEKYSFTDKTISAGDSLMDLDMLLSTDYSIAVYGELSEKLKNHKNTTVINSPVVSDKILEKVMNFSL